MMLGHWLKSKNNKTQPDQKLEEDGSEPPANPAVSVPPELVAALMRFRDGFCDRRYAMNRIQADPKKNRVSATNGRILLSVEVDENLESLREYRIAIPKIDAESMGKFPNVDSIHELHSSGCTEFKVDLEYLKIVVDSLSEITIANELNQQLVTIFVPESSTDPIHFHAEIEDGSAKAAMMTHNPES